MKPGTRIAIGAVLVATGVFVASLGWFADDVQVRQVPQILAAPAAHAAGAYTLVGVPQPAEVPVTSQQGVHMVPNPEHPDAAVQVVAWQSAGRTYHSTLEIRAAQEGRETRFTLTNTTREPGNPQPAWPATQSAWRMPGTAFPVRGFQAGAAAPPVIWAVYDGPFKDPLQPKPSQFVGHVATTDAAGQPLPAGAIVYRVDSYTAGCSSKFIPPEEQERLAQANGAQ